MPDEPESLDNHHMPDEQEDLYPVGLRALHERLAVIGERWRVGIPSGERTSSFARQLVASDEAPANGDDAPEIVTEVAVSRPATPIVWERGPRARRYATIAAAILTVSLIAGVLANLGSHRGARLTTTPTATARVAVSTATSAPRPGVAPPRGNWTSPTALANQETPPVYALSDPLTVFEASHRLMVSHTGGATWTTLTVPTPSTAGGDAPSVSSPIVSSADPNTFLVDVGVQLPLGDTSPCPSGMSPLSYAPEGRTGSFRITTSRMLDSASAALPSTPRNGGSTHCNMSLVTRDGGQTWQAVHVPLGPYVPNLGGQYVLASGGQLFGLVHDIKPSLSAPRLVSSATGADWQFADASLAQTGLAVCNVVGSAHEATLYALVSTERCYPRDPGTWQMWSLDTGTATWSKRGDIVGTYVQMFSTIASTSDTPALYLSASDDPTGQSSRILSSVDGGKTWQSAPMDGVPHGYTALASATGALSDHSIVEVFAESASLPEQGSPVTVAYFAWRAGDSSWRQVSPSITLSLEYDDAYLVIPDANGENDLRLIEHVQTAQGPSGYTAHEYVLR